MCAPIPQGKWAWKHDRCVECKTTEIKHKGRGLCLLCFDRERTKTPTRKASRLKASRNFVKKHRHKEWFKKGRNEKAKKYYNKNKNNQDFMQRQRELNLKSYYKLKGTILRIHQQRTWQRRCRLRKYFKEFIKGNEFYLRKYKGGLKFRCNGCEKECLITSPIKCNINTGNEDMIYLLDLFKSVLINNCKNKI